jgi:transposase
LNENKGIEERLDKVNKKLDLLTVIILVNSGMKLKDIAQTIGVSVRTIQNWLPVAKLKYAKGGKGQPALDASAETSMED